MAFTSTVTGSFVLTIKGGGAAAPAPIAGNNWGGNPATGIFTVRVLPFWPPSAATAQVTGVPTVVQAGKASVFTVKSYDQYGNAMGYQV